MNVYWPQSHTHATIVLVKHLHTYIIDRHVLYGHCCCYNTFCALLRNKSSSITLLSWRSDQAENTLTLGSSRSCHGFFPSLAFADHSEDGKVYEESVGEKVYWKKAPTRLVSFFRGLQKEDCSTWFTLLSFSISSVKQMYLINLDLRYLQVLYCSATIKHLEDKKINNDKAKVALEKNWGWMLWHFLGEWRTKSS